MAEQLITVASGQLRHREYVLNPNTSLYERATLIEGARTNEVLRSDALDNAAWTKVNASVTADQATGPDNATTLDELVEDATAGVSHYTYQDATLTADADYALSCWGIANTRNWIILRLGEAAAFSTNFSRAWFNLTTGAVGTTGANGTGAFTRAYVEDWTGVVTGLYRCVLVGSVGNSATSIRAAVMLDDSDGGTTYNGDGSSSAYVGFAQVEDSAAMASSYLSTAGSTVARNADVFYVPFTAPPQAMTGYLRFFERGATFNDPGAQRLFQIGLTNGTTDPRLLVISTLTGYRINHDNGTTTPSATLAARPAWGNQVELRPVLNEDGSVLIGQSINGAAETTAQDATTATLASAWAGERLYIGSAPGGSNAAFAAFTHVRFAPGVQTMAQMRTLAGT